MVVNTCKQAEIFACYACYLDMYNATAQTWSVSILVVD
jgi:hypothetical protein